MTDEDVIETMSCHGGSFVQALAFAWRRADAENQARLQAAFADVWAKYRELAELRVARTRTFR